MATETKAKPQVGKPEVIEQLNLMVALSADLRSQVKQAHWNVVGENFIAIHKLFDELAATLLLQVQCEQSSQSATCAATSMATWPLRPSLRPATSGRSPARGPSRGSSIPTAQIGPCVGEPQIRRQWKHCRGVAAGTSRICR